MLFVREPLIREKTPSHAAHTPLRVLYSFPNRIGAGRICWTAWQQVAGLAEAGADVTVLSGSCARPLPPSVRLHTTLALGRLRIPARMIHPLWRCRLHDWRTAIWLRTHALSIDLVHAWPVASLRTIRTARALGIPVVLERPNTHTRHAYAVAEVESRRVGINLPAGHDHRFNPKILAREEAEYNECNFLLCPSPYVAGTFRAAGFSASKLLHHHYGFDETIHTPGEQGKDPSRGLVMLYAGVCEPRKGLHYALEAWLASGAHERGTFLICGDFVPGYAGCLASFLSHPSVKVLGHRNDLPELMRKSDLFVLPSVEEGSALVTYEARGCGCVLAVSDAAGAVCHHMRNGFIHHARDVNALTAHIALADRDRELLADLRRRSLAGVSQITWKAAGIRLLDVYLKVAARSARRAPAASLVPRFKLI